MNQIAQLRSKAGISQKELAEALGWTQGRVSNYEAGSRTPGLAESRAIVAALNSFDVRCTLDEVFPPVEVVILGRREERRQAERRQEDRRAARQA